MIKLPKKLPSLFKNFFFVTSVLFTIWMFFLNSTDVISVFKLKLKLSELEDKKAFYEEKIEEVNRDREALLNNEKLLEKFAREKYLMKRPNEEVFIVTEEE